MNDSNLSENVLIRYSQQGLLEEFIPSVISVEKIVQPIWYAIGFCGNPVSAIIWLGRRMRRSNSSAIYLGVLSISDFTFLLLHLVYTLHASHGYDTYNTASGCSVFHMFFMALQYLSVLLVFSFTAERYVAVCHPFLKEKWCTVRRACFITSVLVFISLALASAQAYIWEFMEGYDICVIRAEAFVGDPWSFWNVWTWVSEMLVFALVPFATLTLNCMVLREIYKLAHDGVISRQSRSGNTATSTVTLLTVSFYLIVTQLIATLFICLQPVFPHGDIYLSDDEIRSDPQWAAFFNYISWRKAIEVVLLSHFSVYVFIYCWTGKHFRMEVLYILTCAGKWRWLQDLCLRSQRREHYSAVSTNGHAVSDTYTNTFTTTL